MTRTFFTFRIDLEELAQKQYSAELLVQYYSYELVRVLLLFIYIYIYIIRKYYSRTNTTRE